MALGVKRPDRTGLPNTKSKGNRRSGSRSRIELFEVLQHLVNEVRAVVLSVPRPNKLKQKQRLRECSLLFWHTLRAKGQKLDLGEEEVMQEIEKDFFFLAHQVATESFNYLPDATVLQPFPDLRVVVGRSATNLLGGDQSIAAHVDMLMLMVVGSRVV